jgi:hypothetical protein
MLAVLASDLIAKLLPVWTLSSTGACRTRAEHEAKSQRVPNQVATQHGPTVLIPSEDSASSNKDGVQLPCASQEWVIRHHRVNTLYLRSQYPSGTLEAAPSPLMSRSKCLTLNRASNKGIFHRHLPRLSIALPKDPGIHARDSRRECLSSAELVNVFTREHFCVIEYGKIDSRERGATRASTMLLL